MKTLELNKFETLPAHLKNEVIDFIDFLLEKEKKKSTLKTKNVKRYFGIISDEEAKLWKQNIDECKKIDYDGWK